MKRLLLFEMGWVAFFMLLIALVSSSVVALYMIESDSMEPNILPGDRILVNRLAYGLQLPFSQSKIFSWGEPGRGDVIFFRFDGAETVFIKRVVGLPGDVVSFKRGIVSVNGVPMEQETAQHPFLRPALPGLSERVEWQLKLNLTPHHILMSSIPDRTFFETRRYVVPEGHDFVLGDNRDDSVDSRQFGFVAQERIIGHSLGVLFSTTGSGFLWPDFRIDRFLNLENR